MSAQATVVRRLRGRASRKGLDCWRGLGTAVLVEAAEVIQKGVYPGEAASTGRKMQGRLQHGQHRLQGSWIGG